MKFLRANPNYITTRQRLSFRLNPKKVKYVTKVKPSENLALLTANNIAFCFDSFIYVKKFFINKSFYS